MTNSTPLPPALVPLVESPAITSLDLLAQASRVVVARHVAQLYKHHGDIGADDDTHAVHQLRVATRRIRAVLAATGAVFRPRALAPLAKRLRRLAHALGSVRDADVFLIHLREYAATLEPAEQDGLASLVAQLQAERATAHAALTERLTGKRYRRLLDGLTEFLTAPLPKLIADDDGLPVLVRHHAGGAIWQRYEAVRRYETVLPTASDEQLHELRIAGKHLRYTLELFEPTLGAKIATVLKPIVAAQEQLGTIHDSDVALGYLAEFGAAHGDDPALAQYAAQRQAERAAAAARIPALWTTLTGETVRKALGRGLAEL